MVEHLVVAQEVVGSSPTSHPNLNQKREFIALFLFRIVPQIVVLVIKLPVSNGLQFNLDAGVVWSNPFDQVDIDHPVVINA